MHTHKVLIDELVVSENWYNFFSKNINKTTICPRKLVASLVDSENLSKKIYIKKQYAHTECCC